ncbi:MAG: bifunctional diguanylate cyclase/phosphodiesterase [Halofilum sp. (in: g-proteobacteria)]|nr:bifunctional diguanylate cyclase/phosphodiesterase [Halofilum sp. (in: g-proteobacteria)]
MHIDITERKLAEQELERIAYQDPLTGLWSRQGLGRALAARFEHTGWQPGARVVMLNLRHQRDVNDAHGYAIGDQVLIEVAHRLVERAGDGALVARPGGDEFAVFLPAHAGPGRDRRVAAIAATFDQPIELEHFSVDAGAQFGVTLLGERERPPEELMREAAVALFHGRDGRQRSAWNEYSPEIDRERQERVELTRDLQRALANDEFQLHFQPKVRLADGGQLVAAEALLRWHHPERGLQSPATFIPIAEQSQLIAPIGDWVLREACSFLREWRRAGLDIVRIAINVSLVQFTVGDFVSSVRAALDAYAVPPSSLTLEITESVFEQESDELYRQLHALHELGVQLSLDDFGTGYSSLLYLQRYPFDEIKIDQAFVRNILDDDYSRRIVNTVLGLCGALGAEPIAEGIESEAVRDALLELGCRVGQGFHYSMPLEAEDFRWLLEQGTALPLSGSGAP